MKILISGRRGKLCDAVTGAFSRRKGFRAEFASVGSHLLEMAQSGSYDGLVFVAGGEVDAEPVRWLLQRNPALPLIAVLPGASPKLRKELEREGVALVVEAGGLSATDLQRGLREQLEGLRARGPRQDEAVITTDLHTIRSALTAIQGHAELALGTLPAPSPRRKPLEEIVEEVVEVEGILRRIERKLKPRRPTSQR